MQRKISWITALILLFVLIAGSLTGCGTKEVAGQGFRFPLSAEPQQIDPQVSTDAASVTMVASLFEGLARLDENGNAIPGAATWKVSSDGLTYTFTLKDSKWSDGTSVTAQDFVFGMQRSVLPSTGSTLAEQLFEIQGAKEVNAGTLQASGLAVKAVSEKVLTITLVESDTDFPKKTASTPFMPCKKSFFESTEGRYGLEMQYILTNGPFSLANWTHNQSLLLDKNEGYHDAANISPSAVRYMIGDVNDAVKELTEGNLDAAPISSDKLGDAEQAGLTLTKQKDTIEYIWLNNSNETLKNVSVRQALRDGLEWKTVYAQFGSATASPAVGFVSPDAVITGATAYRTSSNAHTPASLGTRAQTELNAGLQTLGVGKMPALTLLCADDDYSVNLARYIVQSWQKNLSLYFVIKTVSSSELAARVKVGNYQIALYAAAAPGPTAIDALGSFVSDHTGNYSHFSNTDYDALYAEAAVGNASRGQLEQMEKMLWQFCPSMPLSFVCTYVGIPANDSGIIVRSFGGGAFGAPYDFRSARRKEK